jgi:hypothetical protein
MHSVEAGYFRKSLQDAQHGMKQLGQQSWKIESRFSPTGRLSNTTMVTYKANARSCRSVAQAIFRYAEIPIYPLRSFQS